MKFYVEQSRILPKRNPGYLRVVLKVWANLYVSLPEKATVLPIPPFSAHQACGFLHGCHMSRRAHVPQQSVVWVKEQTLSTLLFKCW